MPVALSIAGSDSGGGAGIQADLRAFTALGVYGTTALTAVTAQNLEEVSQIEPVSTPTLSRQIEAVFAGYAPAATKVGMVASLEQLEAIACSPAATGRHPLVVDPVMVATSGKALSSDEVIVGYATRLLPYCTLVTPNLEEAARLLGQASVAERPPNDVARQLAERVQCAVLLKGGHSRQAGALLDVLWTGQTLSSWRHERVEGVHTHGTGCALSAAIAARLAQGAELARACGDAIAFVQAALRRPLRLSQAQVLRLA